MNPVEIKRRLKIHRTVDSPGPDTDQQPHVRLHHGRGSSLPYSTDAILELGKEELLKRLWSADRRIYKILKNSPSIIDCRNNLFQYINEVVRSYYNIYSEKQTGLVKVIK